MHGVAVAVQSGVVARTVTDAIRTLPGERELAHVGSAGHATIARQAASHARHATAHA